MLGKSGWNIESHDTVPAMGLEIGRKRACITAEDQDEDKAMFKAPRPSPRRTAFPHPRQDKPAEMRRRKDALNRTKEKWTSFCNPDQRE